MRFVDVVVGRSILAELTAPLHSRAYKENLFPLVAEGLRHVPPSFLLSVSSLLAFPPDI